MQFSKLEVKPRYIKHALNGSHIEGQKVCKCCQSRPVAGYVVGSGQYLDKLCLKCFRSAGIESKDRASTKAGRTIAKKGRS